MKEDSGGISGSIHSIRPKIECVLPLSTPGSEMPTPEVKEAQMNLARNLFIMTAQNVEFLTSITVSTTRKCSDRTTMFCHHGDPSKSNESTDRGIEKWFPGMLPKVL
jgi:hypothetical protein